MKLTNTQQRLLDYLRERILIHHLPPTRSEISGYFGWKSPNAAQDHLMALQAKGAIVVGKRASRNISLCELDSGAPGSGASTKGR